VCTEIFKLQTAFAEQIKRRIQMGRTSQEITQSEVDTFLKFCSEHRIVTDDEVGRANGDLIGEYIVLTWETDITPRTLAVALEKLGDRIVFYSEAEWQYKQIADQDPARAQALSNWFHTPGNTSLVKDGEQQFQNQSALLSELRGREITPRTIQDAIGRASFKRGLHFVYQSTFRPGRHSGSDSSWMKKDDVNLSPLEKVRRAREAADNAAGRTSTPTQVLDSSEQAWKDLATSKLRNGKSHSQNDELQRIYDQGRTGRWRRVNDEMGQIIKREQGRQL
jgi:hypothetical protein